MSYHISSLSLELPFLSFGINLRDRGKTCCSIQLPIVHAVHARIQSVLLSLQGKIAACCKNILWNMGISQGLVFLFWGSGSVLLGSSRNHL